MGLYVFAHELPLHGLDGPAVVAKSRVIQRYVPTVDDVLASCPSVSEIRTITADFDIRWDPYLGKSKYTCTPGGTGSSAALGLWNVFRCLRLITFDSPVPLFNERNLYRWLKNARSVAYGTLAVSPIYIDHETTGGESRDAGNPVAYMGRPASPGIHIMDSVFGRPNSWLSPYGMRNGGVMGVVEILLHETWHGVSRIGMPDCQPGGTDQAVYWYYKWLSEHSGPYLNDEQKAVASRAAEVFLSELSGC